MEIYCKQFFKGELKFVFVNTDEERRLAERYYKNEEAFCLIFKEYKIIFSRKDYMRYDDMYIWLYNNRSSFIVNHKYVTDDSTFENEVLKSTLPVFVYEYSMNDYRCVMEQSRLKSLAPEYNDKVKFVLKPRMSDGYSTYHDPINYIQLDSQNGIGGVSPSIRIPMTKENALLIAKGVDVELEEAQRILTKGE